MITRANLAKKEVRNYMFNFGIAEVIDGQFAWFECGCSVGTEGRYATADQCEDGHRFYVENDDTVEYR